MVLHENQTFQKDCCVFFSPKINQYSDTNCCPIVQFRLPRVRETLQDKGTVHKIASASDTRHERSPRLPAPLTQGFPQCPRNIKFAFVRTTWKVTVLTDYVFMTKDTIQGLSDGGNESPGTVVGVAAYGCPLRAHRLAPTPMCPPAQKLLGSAGPCSKASGTQSVALCPLLEVGGEARSPQPLIRSLVFGVTSAVLKPSRGSTLSPPARISVVWQKGASREYQKTGITQTVPGFQELCTRNWGQRPSLPAVTTQLSMLEVNIFILSLLNDTQVPLPLHCTDSCGGIFSLLATSLSGH